MIRFRYSIFTILALLISVLAGDCKTTELPVISGEQSVQDNLSEEDRLKKAQALQLVNAGHRSFQKGKLEESLEIAHKSLEIYPTTEAYYLGGISLVQKGKNLEARSYLEKAHALNPSSEKVLLSLGILNSTLGYNREAMENYRSLQLLNPGESMYVYREAVEWKAMKEYNTALNVLLSIDPSSFLRPAELYSQIGDVYLKLKNYEKAKEYFAKAETVSPSLKSLRIRSKSVQVAAFLEEGNSALIKKDYHTAIRAYSDAIQIEPDSYSPYIFRAKVYILNQDYTLAEKDLQKSIQLNDENIAVYETFSLLHYSLGSFSESKRWAEKGLSIFPRSVELRNRVGLAEWKSGNIRQAILQFQKALEIQPDSLELGQNLAYIFLEEGRFYEAKNTLGSLLKKHSNEELRKTLIYAEQMEIIQGGDQYIIQGKLEKAIGEYRRASSLNPQEPAVWNAFGRAYYAFSDYRKSEEMYAKANSLDSENLESLLGLLRVYAITSDMRKQKAIQQKLEKITQGSPELLIAIARIKEDRGDLVGAEKDYLEIRKKYPENEAVKIRLGVLYYKMALQKNEEEDYSSALSFLEKSRRENPGLAEAEATERIIRENLRFAKVIPVIREANRFYEQKEYKKALPLYKKAYRESAKPNLLVKVAECYVGMGQDEKAMVLLEKSDREAGQKSTDFREAIYSYFFQKGEIQRAEKGFLEILSQNPASYFSFYKLGLIQLEKKDYTKAIEYFDKALMLHFRFPAANTAKGIAYYRLGDTKRAREEFNLAYTKDKDFEIARLNVGILYFNENEKEKAKEIFLELAKSKESVDAFLQLSYMEFKAGNVKMAERYILEALSIERSPEVLLAYIRILEAKGDWKARDAIAAEVLRNFPNSMQRAILQEESLAQRQKQEMHWPKGGEWRSVPVMNSEILVRHFPNSILATDIRMGTTRWRILPEEKIETIHLDWHLLGVGRKNAFVWSLEDGSLIQRIPIHLEEGSQVLFARFYLPSEKVGVFVRRKSRDSSPHYVWIVADLSGIVQNLPFKHTAFGVLGEDPLEPIFVTHHGFESQNEFFPWNESLGTIFGTGKQVKMEEAYFFSEGLILRSETGYWEVKDPKKIRKLDFAEKAVHIQPNAEGYISFHILDPSGEQGCVRVWNAKGTMLKEIPWKAHPEIQTLTLSK